MTRIFLLVAAFFFSVSFTRAGDNPLTSRNLLGDMLNAIDNTRTLEYNFQARERFDNKEVYTEMDVKLLTHPFKVYAYTRSEPNKGVEVLYIDGMYDNRAYVNAGRWLPNLKLDPYGGRMRKDQHNTILNSGFETLGKIIKAAIKRADRDAPPGEFENLFAYKGTVTWQGRQCYKVEITDPEFHYINYTVKEGENVNTIANSRGICGYLIVEKNDNIKDFDDIEPGVTVKIPSSYAKRTVLYIDSENFLPIVQIMYDEVGQFERYEFHDLKVNPPIKDIEFTPDYEGYNF